MFPTKEAGFARLSQPFDHWAHRLEREDHLHRHAGSAPELVWVPELV